MAETIRVQNINQISQVVKMVTDALFGGPINIKITKAKRTISQNDLYWHWLTVMAAHFTERGRLLNKDDAHDLMRHKFLGYETKVIGQTEITRLRSTTALEVGEMSHYMTLIDNWCADHGCLLPKPEDSAYIQYQREMGEVA